MIPERLKLLSGMQLFLCLLPVMVQLLLATGTAGSQISALINVLLLFLLRNSVQLKKISQAV